MSSNPESGLETDQASFLAMLAQSGMHVPSEQLTSLFEGYRHLVRAVLALGRSSTMDDEPAVIFKPAQC
jgi:hypothetical protein